MIEENSDTASVIAIAVLIREAFPELEGRAFAVMEATVTKENAPNLPLCFVALLGIRAMNQSNNVNTPLDIEETICVEFWLPSKNYKRNDGSDSPFYAYQDYKSRMDKLFEILTGFHTPQRKPVRFVALDVMADEYCMTMSFKFSVEWRWCVQPDERYHPVRIRFDIAPQRVPPLVGGSMYHPIVPCLPGPPSQDVDTPPPIIIVGGGGDGGGGSGDSLGYDEFIAASNGAQSRTYDADISSSCRVFINGLIQESSAFSFTGSVITLPSSLSIRTGDFIRIEH